MRAVKITLIAFFAAAVLVSPAKSHCQIPCGIYDDKMRINMLSEHIDTIEKSARLINEISADENGDKNQLVRWVNNKEAHSNELSDIITYYFMAQRVKPVEDGEADGKSLAQLVSLHKLLVLGMKAKQSSDTEIADKLRAELDNFEELYFGEDSSHSHSDDHGHKH